MRPASGGSARVFARVVALAAALGGCEDCRARGDELARHDGRTAPSTASSVSPAPSTSPGPSASTSSSPAQRRAAALPPGFLKGQLHAHSSGSDDSQTSPVDVHRWYEARGYDFLVFTDHNHVTDTTDGHMLTLPGVELTRNLRACQPPPPVGVPCALHTNALFVSTSDAGTIDPGDAANVDRLAVYRGELAKAKSLHGIAMLNHPNMFSGADASIVTALAREGLTLLEVANQAWDAKNEGDDERRSTEAIWDDVLAAGGKVFGTATDDAHHYDDADAMRARGERPFPGDLGFVVVRAAKNARAIRSAIEHGDFYASTGVLFVTYRRTATSLDLAVADDEPMEFEAVAHGGRVTDHAHGTRFAVKLGPDDGPYVRVRVKRKDGAVAFSQPLFRSSKP
ncbi:MAG: PHP domain-containing protein [Deltaproteobacteria bacterium]|nr:PHP domain-containing protein [Deltaproteobacteria bacterium]